MWESNPPCRIVAGNTGFEVREGHQNPIHSQSLILNDFPPFLQALIFPILPDCDRIVTLIQRMAAICKLSRQ